jgi:hypothetical protein
MEEVTAAIDEREREREREREKRTRERASSLSGVAAAMAVAAQREPVPQKSPTITVTDLRASWPFKLSNFEFFSIFLTNHNNRKPNNHYLGKEALITPNF